LSGKTDSRPHLPDFKKKKSFCKGRTGFLLNYTGLLQLIHITGRKELHNFLKKLFGLVQDVFKKSLFLIQYRLDRAP